MRLENAPPVVKLTILTFMLPFATVFVTVVGLAPIALMFLAITAANYLYTGNWSSITPNELGLSKLKILHESEAWKGLIELILKVGDWNIYIAAPIYLWLFITPPLIVLMQLFWTYRYFLSKYNQ